MPDGAPDRTRSVPAVLALDDGDGVRDVLVGISGGFRRGPVMGGSTGRPVSGRSGEAIREVRAERCRDVLQAPERLR